MAALVAAGMSMVLAAGLRAQDLDAEYARELLGSGTAAPAFVLPDGQGAVHSLADYRGSYVVLDFWATWCPDCRADVPAMKELFARYGGKAVFIGISFDTDADRLSSYVAENGIGWLQLSELKKWKETQVSQDYHVRWIPSLYLIGPDGRVVLGTVMLSKLEAALAAL